MGPGEQDLPGGGVASSRWKQRVLHGVRGPRTAGFRSGGAPRRPWGRGHAERLPQDIAFLAQSGVAERSLAFAAALARDSDLPASEILIRRGVIRRDIYEEALALHLGAGYGECVPHDARQIDARQLDGPWDDEEIQALPFAGATENAGRVYVSAQDTGAAWLIAKATEAPDLMSGVVLVGSAQLRMARFARSRHRLVEQAGTLLQQRFPGLSARRRVSPAQRLTAAAGAGAAAALTALDPATAFLAAGTGLMLVYTACILLRALLLWRLDALPRPQEFAPTPVRPEELPVYTILAALYREAGEVRDLVAALERLDWPQDRREVFLVCEEDDPETLAAIGALDLPPGFHLLACPPSLPRTKPKALNFALPIASGEFLVIFDAEDRPHPLQLREAYERFRSADARLACLQAPLTIHNRHQNWLTAMFAFEYDTLFRGLLPVLESIGAPIPLGGTSNHFRLAALRRAGGWDPWNMTEDADLGVRLARFGYRCGTIALPTFEEAPPHLGGWIRQRTRWIKGWIQTVLVHTRSPLQLRREMGLRGAILFFMILAMPVVSILAHPFCVAQVTIKLHAVAGGARLSGGESVLLAGAVFNLVAGYSTYGALAHEIAGRMGHRHPWRMVSFLPAYWALMSYAGWRAVWKFMAMPFQWEKTTHGLAKSPPDANIARGALADLPGRLHRAPKPRFHAVPFEENSDA